MHSTRAASHAPRESAEPAERYSLGEHADAPSDGAAEPAAPTRDDIRHQSPRPAEDGVAAAFGQFCESLKALARSDPGFRAACAKLGRWLTELGQSADQGADGLPSDAAASTSAPLRPEVSRVQRTLSIGGVSIPISVADDGEPRAYEPPPARSAAASPEPAPQPAAAAAPPTLATVAERARAKAECCRWAIERRKRMEDGVDFDQLIKPRDSELTERLRSLPDCYGWPLDPYLTLPDDRRLDAAAGCYEGMADALLLAERIRADEDLFESLGQQAYELLAECCSALRVALLDCDVRKEADQDAAFGWLRTRVFEDSIYVARHMRLDDPADPVRWPERREALSEVVERIESRQAESRERRNLLGRLDYIAKRWPDYGEAEREDQACKFASAVDRLVQLGVRPSDPRIRDPLLAIADGLPENLPPIAAFDEAVRFADEHAARRESEPGTQPAAEPTADVIRARELLRGRVVVMIGGLCRPRSRDALCEGLELAELRWISSRPHEPISHFEAHVRRPDVALVMLAIRWASHSFEEIKRTCLAAGKPFVRLPRGYGLNQVAAEVMRQASRELTPDRTR